MDSVLVSGFWFLGLTVRKSLVAHKCHIPPLKALAVVRYISDHGTYTWAFVGISFDKPPWKTLKENV